MSSCATALRWSVLLGFPSCRLARENSDIMSYAATIAVSPSLAPCFSPLFRTREEVTPPKNSYSSPHTIRMSPSSPLLCDVLPPSPVDFTKLQCSPQTPRRVRSSCSCKNSIVCSSCTCTLATSPESTGKIKGSRASISFQDLQGNTITTSSWVSTAPKPVSPMKPPKGLSFVNALPKSAFQTNSADRPRTALGVRDDNQVNPLPPSKNFFEFDGHTAGNPAAAETSSLKEKTRQKLGSIRGKEDSFLVGSFTSIDANRSKPVSSPLKRKRPPKLDIPESASLATSTAVQHVQSKEDLSKEINIEGSNFGISCKKGKREFMEDTHRAITDLQGNSKQAFYGVFDGHGGRKAADFVADNLAENIVAAFATVQSEEDYIENAVRAGYISTDAGLLQKRVNGGASSVTALVKDGYLVVANAGDCRAVLSRRGQAEALTSDHRPSREDERKRIEKLGGYVDCFNGIWRVQGVLGVSRGFGDLHLKEWISVEPEVKKIPITTDCEFLILASDGLWDKVTNEEAVDCAKSFLKGKSVKPSSSTSSHVPPHNQDVSSAGGVSFQKEGFRRRDESPPIESASPFPIASAHVIASRKLVEMAASRGSRDDISVMIVDLRNFCEDASFFSS